MMDTFRARCLKAADELGITDREAFAREMENMLAEMLAFVRAGRGDATAAARHVARERGVVAPT